MFGLSPELYALLAPRLYHFCRYLAGFADADDVLQDVFLKVHRARGTYAPGGSVVAWTFAIARTTCIDRQRRRKRRPEHATGPEQMMKHEAESTCDPEARAADRAFARALEQALACLSENLRSAYVLVKLEDMSHLEAAAILGVSVSALKQRVHRATEELRQALGEREC